MPARINKRQQREQEELLALANQPAAAADADSEEEPAPGPIAPSGFAALFTAESDHDVPESDDETSKPTKAKKAKKKKKKPTASDAPTSPQQSKPAEVPKPQQPKSAKKGKGKEKKKGDLDDLDTALAELSQKYPELQSVATSSSSTTRNASLASLLSVSVSNLDAEAEMRKFFGARAVIAAKSSENSSSGGSKKRRGIASAQTQRSQLTRPHPSWSMIKQREGLSSRPLTDEEVQKKVADRNSPAAGDKWWTVEYSKRYKGVTKTFMQAVMSGDPEALWRVLQKLPWHGDTLLQLAEVYRHREEYSQAVEYVDRALFAYERAFLGAFSFANGLNRLDFNCVENRPFFLALHRQVTDLQRRGCIRTAFEFGRLLYSLEPWTDPHGVLFHLDFVSIKSGMGQWLLDIYSEFAGTKTAFEDHLNPSVLPGWAYARALALFAREKAGGGQSMCSSMDALKQAMLAFPEVVPLLADKCDISLSPELRGHRAFRIHTDGIGLSPAQSVLHLLSHLYAQKSAPLWKSAAHVKWFESTANEIRTSLNAQRFNPTRERFLQMYASTTLRYSVYRHIIVLEQSFRNLTPFIPRSVLLAKQLACDPLPPLTASSEYNDAFFAGAEEIFSVRPRRRDARALERLIPDAGIRAQIEALFDANPGLAGQLPGGVVQFVQMMADMPDEALDDMMLGLAMDGEGGVPGGGMPGGLPLEGDDDLLDFDPMPPRGEVEAAPALAVEDESEGDEEDEDEDEYIAPMPIRVVRNLLNRFWGGGGATADSDGSDSDAEERDHDGVD
ncbi:transcriptional repressor TCF25-domain-containing protein [Suillus clintonianus]|uniref:transcriptional repressor TCF25-domain-containing protein n=1 Tax=Suillus clintonianus TaxID=1904413 RepID=UPI001B85DDE1|nr:transcriptional repressor TCF25-domain-containing protein [Suillus clintonianus]KAG2124676.1 transcriptional repressor TCF25-domain-containing protein [Suillus clintonianus]